MDSLKIALIGTGNLAWHLVKATQGTLVQWTGVWSRNLNHLESFCKEWNLPMLTSINHIDDSTDLIILAITDDAISSIDHLIPQQFTVVHTAGAVSIDQLHRPSRGVIWTLQTLRKNQMVRLGDAPFFIESTNEETQNKIEHFLNFFGAKAHHSSSESRSKIHLAAVFANNFSNHLFTLANEILKKENIPFDVLLPILTVQIEKLKTKDSKDIQTGPAFRNDQFTISKHLELLKDSPELSEVYACLTEAIIKFYHDQKL